MGAVLLILLVVIGLLVVWPITVAIRIGEEKSISGAWLWGAALGWIGVWVLMAHQKPQQFHIELSGVAAPALKACPWCAEFIKADAVVCRFCSRGVTTSEEIAP